MLELRTLYCSEQCVEALTSQRNSEKAWGCTRGRTISKDLEMMTPASGQAI